MTPPGTERSGTKRSGPGRSGAVRTPLTRHRILRVALGLVESGGPDALSMRRVARELGVEAMSLYNHIQDKADILDGLAEFVLEGVDLPRVPSGDWEGDVRALSAAFRRAALAHPRACTLVLTRQLHSPVALGATDATLCVLLDAGFDEGTAVHALRAFLAFQIGSILREVGASPTFNGQDADGVRARTEELSGSGFPALARVAPLLAECDNDAEYSFGVEALLSALRLLRDPR